MSLHNWFLIVLFYLFQDLTYIYQNGTYFYMIITIKRLLKLKSLIVAFAY